MNKEFIEKLKYEVSAGEYTTIKTKDLEEILNYIDNSISKEVIVEKIKDLVIEEESEYFDNSKTIKTLQEFLKQK